MTYQAVISNSATDWAGTWLVTDEQYNIISKHSSREAAELETVQKRLEWVIDGGGGIEH